ncbi:GCN5-related N-acetyltransferase [Actinobacteria bacterium OK074]|nr:GCN5-related N-acetyltransferase [Actinobacteria bacterium OK074]
MDGLVRAWIDGWVVSRGAAPPVREPWGYTVDVGQVEQVTRHVFDALNDAVDEADVRKVASAVTGAGVWLKVFTEPERVGPWLGDGWRLDATGYLMSTRLDPTSAPPPAAPTGYRTRTWSRGGVIQTLIAAPDGALAARGQIALPGRTAVLDRIETAPAHRRKGLGSLVVRTLEHAAANQGAEEAVLGGTPEGRALYEALGWRVEAPLTSAKFTGTGG